jgi:hypothetical protein
MQIITDTENNHSKPTNLMNGKVRDGAGMGMASMGRFVDVGVFPMGIDVAASKVMALSNHRVPHFVRFTGRMLKCVNGTRS